MGRWDCLYMISLLWPAPDPFSPNTGLTIFPYLAKAGILSTFRVYKSGSTGASHSQPFYIFSWRLPR